MLKLRLKDFKYIQAILYFWTPIFVFIKILNVTSFTWKYLDNPTKIKVVPSDLERGSGYNTVLLN